MKKYIAFLLCLIMILSLFSCGKENISQDTNKQDQNEITENISNNVSNNSKSANYDSVLEIYRLIVEKFPIVNQNPRAVAAELGIQDEAEIEAFVNLYSSIHLFYPGIGQEDSVSPHHKLGCGYSVKDLNGDGVDELVLMNKDYYIMAIFSYSNEKPVLLGNYWERNSCWIDGDGLLHNNGSSGADRSTSAIYKIADGGESLELISEFGTNGHEWVDDVAYTKYYKVVGSEKVSIIESEYNALVEQYGKYLGSVESAETTKEYSGLTFTSLYTEAEIAMEMYEAAINDKICVNDEHLGEIKLKACRFPSNNARIDECKLLTKAILDLDQDGVNEYVIKSPDNDCIVLHYYDDKVYSYGFGISNFYNLNTDGTFYWKDSSVAGNCEVGLNKIIFEGETLTIKNIYSIQYLTAETDAYYMGGESVTRDEFLSYYNYNPKTRMSFSPFELTCSYPITANQAWNLANTYWNNIDCRSEGALGTTIIHKVVLLDTPDSDTNYYRIAWQLEYASHSYDGWESNSPYEIKIYKQLFVNASTGKIREYVKTEVDGKG